MLSKKLIPDELEYVDVTSDTPEQKYVGVRLKGFWSKDVAEFINENGVEAIFLNHSTGWKDKDCSFLSEMKSLKQVSILGVDVVGLKALEELPDLEEVSISGTSKESVDFTKIPNLRKVFLDWNKGFTSIFKCSNLKDVYIDSIKVKHLDEFESKQKLISLTIGNSPIEDVSFLKDAMNLEELQLLNCRTLSDFSPITSCKKLKLIRLCGCSKLTKLDFLSSLDSLEVLLMSNVKEVETLSPLSDLKNLKAINFIGSTVISDGDLSVLENLPNLAMVQFVPRRHYTHESIVKWSWKNINSPVKQVHRK